MKQVQQAKPSQLRTTIQSNVQPTQMVKTQGNQVIDINAPVLPEGQSKVVPFSQANLAPGQTVVTQNQNVYHQAEVQVPNVAPEIKQQSKGLTQQHTNVLDLPKSQLRQQQAGDVHPLQVTQTKAQNIQSLSAPVMTQQSKQVQPLSEAINQGLKSTDIVTTQAQHISPSAQVQSPLSAPGQQSLMKQHQAVNQLQNKQLKQVQSHEVLPEQVVLATPDQIPAMDAPVLPEGTSQMMPLGQALSQGLPVSQQVAVQSQFVHPDEPVQAPLSAPVIQQQKKTQQFKQMASLPLAQQKKVQVQQVHPEQIVLTQAQHVKTQDALVQPVGQSGMAPLAVQDIHPKQQVAVQAQHVQSGAQVQVHKSAPTDFMAPY